MLLVLTAVPQLVERKHVVFGVSAVVASEVEAKVQQRFGQSADVGGLGGDSTEKSGKA